LARENQKKENSQNRKEKMMEIQWENLHFNEFPFFFFLIPLSLLACFALPFALPAVPCLPSY